MSQRWFAQGGKARLGNRRIDARHQQRQISRGVDLYLGKFKRSVLRLTVRRAGAILQVAVVGSCGSLVTRFLRRTCIRLRNAGQVGGCRHGNLAQHHHHSCDADNKTTRRPEAEHGGILTIQPGKCKLDQTGPMSGIRAPDSLSVLRRLSRRTLPKGSFGGLSASLITLSVLYLSSSRSVENTACGRNKRAYPFVYVLQVS